MDTAAMLVCRTSLGQLLDELDAAAARCADLAECHRSTVMVGRTLLQHAVPITFGLRAAGWLVGVVEARDRVDAARRALPAQLGGAAGTLALFGDRGVDVLEAFAREVGLVVPTTPWHADRGPVLDVASAVARVAAACDKTAFDVLLLSQTDVAEVVEPSVGGSSTMPHKRNPVGSALARACATRARAAAAALLTAPSHELERAAGAWHAEWGFLSDALAHAGGAVSAIRGVLAGLEVDAGRMRANLAASGGVAMAERAQQVLQESVGRDASLEILRGLLARVQSEGIALPDLLVKELPPGMDRDAVSAAMDPASYLGSVEAFVDRALDRFRGAGARGVSERQRTNVAPAETEGSS
jgi:3-carboxy-cis,cis-muconate cycloisomerase